MQLICNAAVQLRRRAEQTFCKAYPDNRVFYGPVPFVMAVQPPEKRLVTLKHLFQCVKEETFAEPAGTGEKVILAILCKFMGKGGLVHIIVVFFPYLTEGLYTYGEFSALGHGNAPEEAVLYQLYTP